MLYIVGTPIGNLEDLSLRQARIIMQVPIILCEDTRSTGLLIEHIHKKFSLARNPDQKLISYYKEKEFEKLPYAMMLLRSGNDVAVISQSGMPLINDPGFLLLKQAVKENVPYTVIPGPTALTTALAASGFDPELFFFMGFFPKKKSHILRLIDKSRTVAHEFPKTVFIAYESPNRIYDTLAVFKEVAPTAMLCIARELTKKFEEVIRGTPEELLKREFKGEIVFLFKLTPL